MNDASARRYYGLLTSLPILAPPFTEARPPLSRIALDRRLSGLHPDDAYQLAQLESVMFFTAIPSTLSEKELVAHSERVLQSLTSPLLRELAQWRLSLRTALVALRRRSMGHPPPRRDERWGVGPWQHTIMRNWHREDLGLGARVPQIENLARLLAQGRSRELEVELLRRIWRRLSDAAFLRRFDFEAVALYVLRWDVVQRASRHDAARGETRFRALLEEALQEADYD